MNTGAIVKTVFSPLLISVFLSFFPQVAMSAGVTAGTIINNKATVSYTNEGSGEVSQLSSNISSFIVAELLDVKLVWQDASNLSAAPGDIAKVLTFLLTNTGNGTEAYSLDVTNSTVGDDFNPVFAAIYLDSNNNASYDLSDTLYEAGTNDPDLGPDQQLTVFVLNDIPSGLNDGDKGISSLTATSRNGSGPAGTLFPGKGDDGTNAIVGFTEAAQTANGVYEIRSATVLITKSAEIINSPYATKPLSGATIRYTIRVSASGKGVAEGVVISDPLAPETTYIAGTLTLNGNPLSDVSGDDEGDFSQTLSGTLTIVLGDMTSATAEQIISFEALIK